MKENKLLHEAIDDYELLSRSSKTILKILTDLEDDKGAIIYLSILKLSKMAKISRTSTYEPIKALVNEGCIQKWTEKRRFTHFLLNHERLNYLIENYLKRKKYFI